MMANPHLLIEGVDHRLVRDPGAATRSSTSAARSLHVIRRLQHAGRGGVRGRVPGQEHPRLRASTWSVIVTPAPAPTSAARRPRCSTRWRATAGQPRLQAAVPGRGRPVRLPDGRQQRRSRSPACPSIVLNGADWFARRWAPRSPRASASSRCPATSTTPGTVRGAARHHAARAARAGRRDARRTPAASSGRPAARRTPLLTDEHLDVPLDFEAVARRRIACSAPRSLQIFDDTTCVVARGAPLDRVLPARVVRQVHAVPRGHATGWSASWTGWNTAMGTEEDLDEAAGHLRQHHRPRVLRASATARPARSPRRSSYFRGRVHRAPHGRRLSVRPGGARLSGASVMTVETTRRTRSPSPSTAFEISVPKGTLDHPGRRAARHRRSRGSATTRCSSRSAPAASAWSRWRASASRWPRAPLPCTEGMVVRTQLTSRGRGQGAARA